MSDVKTEVRLVRPTVTLISEPRIVSGLPYPLVADDLDEVSDGSKVIEFAGRVCYMSFEKGRKTNREYVTHMQEVGHGSVLEHAHFTVLIEGISRSCSHELVRHRHFNYCLDGDAITELTVGTTTKKRTIKELFEMKQASHGRSRLKLVKLNCMDAETGKIAKGLVKDVVFTGRKKCLEVELSGGYVIRSTKNHRFYTPQGWMRLEDALAAKVSLATNGIPAPDTDWLRQEYLVKNRRRSEIAASLGVSDSWLGKRIAEVGLQKPKKQYPNRKGGRGIGWHHSVAVRKKLSESKLGEKNHRWRGGTTRRAQKIRKVITPILRKKVYERDDYTCRLCDVRGGNLTIHHIVPVWQREDLVAEPDNLVTLCRGCHHSINGREHEYAEFFGSLVPIKRRPKIVEALNRTMVKFSSVVSVRDIGEIDTYDIEMVGPHHNFIANGVVVHNSQLSQRYVDSSDVAFVMPPAIRDIPETPDGGCGERAIFLAQCAASLMGYMALSESLLIRELETLGVHDLSELPFEDRTAMRKVVRQTARSVLPNATETKIVMTGNIRSLHNWFYLRGSKYADAEIRELAVKLLEVLQPVTTPLLDHYEVLADGTIVGQYDKP